MKSGSREGRFSGKRRPQFESLESRLALSANISHDEMLKSGGGAAALVNLWL
jgi:hypothetical protein